MSAGEVPSEDGNDIQKDANQRKVTDISASKVLEVADEEKNLAKTALDNHRRSTEEDVKKKTEAEGREKDDHKTKDEEESSSKRFKGTQKDDISDAFSRREINYNKNARPASVYEGEKRETPAWMVSKSTDKYDKYGSRGGTGLNSVRDNSGVDADERYSKYLGAGRAREVNRTARTTEDAEPYAKYKSPQTTATDIYKGQEGDEEETSEAAPYVNIGVANPSANMYQTFQSNIRDKEGKDINSIVRAHYNQRTIQSKYQGSRTKSPIYKLRNFNNAIKYILLNNFVKKTSGKPTVVLDLCCGKGGDLNKFEFVSIDQYIGIDISDASIKEAFSRYSRNKARFIPRDGAPRDSRRYNFDACFATGDCFSNSIPEILEPNFPGIINSLFPVDTVSLQFSMHYSFETEEKVKMMLNNVSRSLRPGGTLIGTIPSSDFIRDKIVKKDFIDVNKFGNDLYTVTFEKEPPENGVFRPPFGHKYNYFLKDAVDNVPEYVVPFEAFRSLCEDFGLVMKYKKNFIEIFNSEIPRYFNKLNKNLIEGMKRADGKFGAEGSQKEAVAFYIGFVFEKLGN